LKFYCLNTATGLKPLYDSDLEEKRKLKIGETYLCEIKKERNYEFHKKFMALIKLGHENTKLIGMNFDAYRAYITMKAGYADVYETPRGKFALPRSISFAKMDQDEFQKLYSASIQVIIDDIGADEQTIENEILNFM